jgi:hypothetical protein
MPFQVPVYLAVVAGNKYGLGVVSKAAKPVVFGGSSPGAPTLQLRENDETGVHIKWTRPISFGPLKVDEFKIYVREKGLLDTQQVYDVKHDTEVVIDELKEDTEYEFFVRAGNDAGFGPRSNIEEHKTGRTVKHRTDLFIILWVSVEVVLVLLIVGIIAFIWRKRQSEATVDYMQLDTMYPDDDLEYGGEKGNFFQVKTKPEAPVSKSKRITIHNILNDINERIEFRDHCEERGYLDLFHFFQVVEDFHRCSVTEQPMRAKEVIRWYLEDNSQRRVLVHLDTLCQIRAELGETLHVSPRLFDGAQKEVVASLEAFALPSYLEDKHNILATPLENFAPMPQVHNSQQVTAVPFNRMVLARLQAPGDGGVLQVRCEEEVGATSPLEFIAAVEKFHSLSTNMMPEVAHDIVEAHMASDSRARVNFSSAVQQELINTARPHSAMFDNAQKEALYILWQILCPTAPMPKAAPGWPRMQ